MKTKISFVDILEEHLPLVQNIYSYYTQHTAYTFHSGLISLNELKEFLFIEHPKYKAFLIFSGDLLAGYCLLTQYKKRSAYDRTAEVSIYLKPDFTGKGLGSVAVKQLETVAGKTGIKVLLAFISEANMDSVRFFEKEGYVRCGHFKQVGEKFGKILDVFAYQKLL